MEGGAQSPASERIRITLLQSTTIAVDGKKVDKLPSAFFRIAAYLIINGPTVSRTKLGHLFWADADETAAAANLRQTLARIRRVQETFGFRLIGMDRHRVFVVDFPSADCDLIEYLDELRMEDGGSPVRLCRLYAGDLLADLVGASPEFQEWLDLHAGELRNRFIDRVGSALSDDATLTGVQRSSCALQLLDIDPFNEHAYRQLMIDAAAMGETAQLHLHYARCEHRLASELGVRPSAETRELYQHLQDQLSTHAVH